MGSCYNYQYSPPLIGCESNVPGDHLTRVDEYRLRKETTNLVPVSEGVGGARRQPYRLPVWVWGLGAGKRIDKDKYTY